MTRHRGRAFTEGLTVGLIGYVVIAMYFAVANLLAGRSPLHTAEMLGRSLMDEGVIGTLPAFAPVVAYNAIHLVILLAIGLGVALLVQATERHVHWWLPLLLLGAGGLTVVALAFFLLIVPGTANLPWLSVVGANVAAGVAMAAYLAVAHPGLWREVEREASAGAI